MNETYMLTVDGCLLLDNHREVPYQVTASGPRAEFTFLAKEAHFPGTPITVTVHYPMAEVIAEHAL